MPTNTNVVEEICYTQDFLTSVIARVDLLNPIESLNKQVPKSLGDLILRDFPMMEPKTAIAQDLKISLKGGVENVKRTEFQEWHFHGKNREKTLTITQNAIIINYKKYNTYNQMRKIL